MANGADENGAAARAMLEAYASARGSVPDWAEIVRATLDADPSDRLRARTGDPVDIELVDVDATRYEGKMPVPHAYMGIAVRGTVYRFAFALRDDQYGFAVEVRRGNDPGDGNEDAAVRRIRLARTRCAAAEILDSLSALVSRATPPDLVFWDCARFCDAWLAAIADGDAPKPIPIAPEIWATGIFADPRTSALRPLRRAGPLPAIAAVSRVFALANRRSAASLPRERYSWCSVA